MPKNIERICLSAVTSGDQAGLRLDQAAAALFPDHSRGRLQKWIRSGNLTVDGREEKPTYRIAGHETLRLDAEVASGGQVRPQNIPLDIIHADEDLIVLNKPAGLVVHPAVGNPDGTLQNGLLHFDESLGGLPRSGIVHRLDKDTSGVMVVARSLRAHTSLVRQLQSRDMSRVYRAVASGELPPRGTVNAPIGRHPRDRKRMAVVSSGKPAVSHFRVLERFLGFCYLEIALETGRTHQIRVHMAHIGHPLTGDPVYGRKRGNRRDLPLAVVGRVRSFPRQALHACRLRLEHPASGRDVAYEAPLPDDFQELLAVLRSNPA